MSATPEKSQQQTEEGVGPEEGLRSGSTAGDNHGATTDSDLPLSATGGERANETPADRRDRDLKQD